MESPAPDCEVENATMELTIVNCIVAGAGGNKTTAVLSERGCLEMDGLETDQPFAAAVRALRIMLLTVSEGLAPTPSHLSARARSIV